jgi:hypothetical protein
MKQTYRGVEFVVNSVDGELWTWDAYPKKADVAGSPLHGKIKRTEADAVKACKDVAITLEAIPLAATRPHGRARRKRLSFW